MAAKDLNPLLQHKSAPPVLLVISGPSGVGKDSILLRMQEIELPFHFVVTATSRPIRPGERNGYDYHFVTRPEFESMIVQDELLEWAEVYGHYKGIPKREVRHALDTGNDVVLRIDVQGAATVRRLAPDAVLIFIAPGNLSELRSRLEARHTELPDEMERRLGVAQREMAEIEKFDYVVFNHDDKLDQAVEQIRAIVIAEKQRVYPRQVYL